MNIKSIVKLANTSYQSLCILGAFNVPTASFNPCLDFDEPNHGVGNCPQKKDQKNISKNKKNFINVNQSPGGSVGEKTWAKRSNKKGQANKSQKQQQSFKKPNGNGDTKSKNGVKLVAVKWLCLCNKGCRFNTSHTTGFHDTWYACVKNNQPFTLLYTHVFQR